MVLVLEEVSPGAPVTARTTDQTPLTAAPGVELADSSSAANRLLERVPPAILDTGVGQTARRSNNQARSRNE